MNEAERAKISLVEEGDKCRIFQAGECPSRSRRFSTCRSIIQAVREPVKERDKPFQAGEEDDDEEEEKEEGEEEEEDHKGKPPHRLKIMANARSWGGVRACQDKTQKRKIKGVCLISRKSRAKEVFPGKRMSMEIVVCIPNTTVMTSFWTGG